MTPTLAIIGSIIIDIMVQTPRLPASSENVHASRIQAMVGGKAANAAATFARLGGSVYLLGNTGDDFFGAWARAQLQAEGIDVSWVHSDASAATGAGILLVEPDGQTAFVIDPGANQTLTPPQLAASLQPLLPQLDGLLLNFESPEPCLLLAVEMAHACSLPIFVDAGPYRPYSPDLWRHAALLTPNEPETAALVGHPLTDDASVVAAARMLLAQGPQAVVIKRGARGALAATSDGESYHPAFSVPIVDSAGAGDAFTAGLVWATLNGQPLSQAVRFANACGAIAVSRLGTMPAMPSLAEVQELMKQTSR